MVPQVWREKRKKVAILDVGDDGTLTKVDVKLDSALRVGPPTSVVLVTCISGKGRPNILTLGMYMHISNEPPLLAIGVSPRRYSHRLIKDAGEFVINVPPMRLIKQVVLCGKASGREGDKFKLTGLTPLPAKRVRSPLIEECVSHLECRTVRSYKAGDHTLFIGRVVAASVERGMMDGTLNVTKAKTVLHKGGRYFTPKLFYRA
jgi:flavin reductase (DIM6/NTAB) family NADH-FMN oxidoreductase RutF